MVYVCYIIYFIIHLFIIFIRVLRNPRYCGIGAHQRQGNREEGKTSKEREKRKEIEAQRGKHPTSSRVTNALIGDEVQNGNQKRTKRKNESGSPIQLPWTIQSTPTTRRDHMVSLFIIL